MGCSCKKMQKIQKDLKEYDGQNDNKLTNYIFDFCLKFLNKVIVILLFIIITPIILLVLLFNFILKGQFALPITRLNKVNVNDLKNELEKII